MLDGRVAIVAGAGRAWGGPTPARRRLSAPRSSSPTSTPTWPPRPSTRSPPRAAPPSPHAGSVGGSDFADALVRRAVDEFGRLDVMITNAGTLRDSTLRNTADEGRSSP